MRILQVTPGYYPVIGGVERHVQALAERLAGRGHEVTVATMQPRGQHLPDETLSGVLVRRFDAGGFGEAYRVPPGLLRFMRATRNRWDVVHVHNYHAALIPLVALAGVHPFVVTTHLNDTPHSAAARMLHIPYTIVGSWAVQQAEAVICVTEAERLRVTQRLGVVPERCIVIPNGVSENVLLARDGARGRDPYLVLSVGRLQPYKRVEDGIAALAKLGRPYRLVVVGDGPHRETLERQTEVVGVSDRVEFVGKAADEELVEWYRRAGVVTSLSEAEAFGLTVLEGVAAGCQVVCSDIPAFRDLAAYFPGHVTVVRRRDPEAVAEAVHAAAKRTTTVPPDVSAFTWDAITERLIDLYRRVAGVVKPAADAEGQHLADPDGQHVLTEG